jgi:hypothetical protein
MRKMVWRIWMFARCLNVFLTLAFIFGAPRLNAAPYAEGPGPHQTATV